MTAELHELIHRFYELEKDMQKAYETLKKLEKLIDKMVKKE